MGGYRGNALPETQKVKLRKNIVQKKLLTTEIYCDTMDFNF
jgi:hypothetical protein